MQGRIAIKRPDQKSAENGLAKNLSDLRSRKVIADVAVILAELDDLGMQAMHPFLQIHHCLANRGRRKIGLKNRADDGRVASRLLGHADAERTEELWHGLVRLPGCLDGYFQLPELHFHESQQDMVFAWEVVEKGAFTDVSGLGNVLDGRFGEAFVGEEIEGRAKEALANFRAVALAAARVRGRVAGSRSRSLGERHGDLHSYMTIGHSFLVVKANMSSGSTRQRGWE